MVIEGNGSIVVLVMEKLQTAIKLVRAAEQSFYRGD